MHKLSWVKFLNIPFIFHTNILPIYGKICISSNTEILRSIGMKNSNSFLKLPLSDMKLFWEQKMFCLHNLTGNLAPWWQVLLEWGSNLLMKASWSGLNTRLTNMPDTPLQALPWWYILRNNDIFAFSLISEHWNTNGSCNIFLWKTVF